MKKVVCCVKDVKVGFATPFCYISDEVAIRSFASTIAQAEAASEVALFPGDFELYKLGTFDTDTGRFECLDSPQFMHRAADVRAMLRKDVVDVQTTKENT